MARNRDRHWRLLTGAALGVIFGSVLLTHAENRSFDEDVHQNDAALEGLNGVGQSAATQKVQDTGWLRYSFDLSNTNHNPTEWKISPRTASNLVRVWETFNDDALLPTPPPTGFVLETALGLRFRSSVVGVVSPPVLRDGIIYYVDELGTMFARDARTGRALEPDIHWTTTLVDPDFNSGLPAVAPDLFYTAVTATKDHVWVLSSVYGRLHASPRSRDSTTGGPTRASMLPEARTSTPSLPRSVRPSGLTWKTFDPITTPRLECGRGSTNCTRARASPPGTSAAVAITWICRRVRACVTCPLPMTWVYVATSSGTLFALEAQTGAIVFQDQTLDLNAHFELGLGKPHHAPMNAGALISDGMVYVPYGGQNEPSGGIIAYGLTPSIAAEREIPERECCEQPEDAPSSRLLHSTIGEFEVFSICPGKELRVDGGFLHLYCLGLA